MRTPSALRLEAYAQLRQYVELCVALEQSENIIEALVYTLTMAKLEQGMGARDIEEAQQVIAQIVAVERVGYHQ